MEILGVKLGELGLRSTPPPFFSLFCMNPGLSSRPIPSLIQQELEPVLLASLGSEKMVANNRLSLGPSSRIGH